MKPSTANKVALIKKKIERYFQKLNISTTKKQHYYHNCTFFCYVIHTFIKLIFPLLIILKSYDQFHKREQAAQLKANGMNNTQIAKQLDVTRRTIINWLGV